MKKHNFSAGPSILPQAVIEQSAQGVLNINNSNLNGSKLNVLGVESWKQFRFKK